MKVVLALSCMAAVASAMPYPMAYPQETDLMYRVPRQLLASPQEVMYRFPRQISRGDDLQTAADTGYAAPGPVSFVTK